MTTKPIRVLHFADAHIDIANYGRHDRQSALPVRVVDFLHALDQIIDTAVNEAVDLVLFAGDAYKDRNPQPTFQREWGKRIIKLSQAGIPTVLLVGNHDVSPASGRAHTLQEFNTLAVPHIHVAAKIGRLGPEQLGGLPVQIITVPWVSRSQMLTRADMAGKSLEDILTDIEGRVGRAIADLIEKADPNLPLILTAHASVQGAQYGSERAVMLGHELVLSRRMVSDKKIDYVALGHIHRHQQLTPPTGHPPIVYPGSIERIDFGEAREKKGFVLAEISNGHTEWQFMPLKTRRFIDLKVETPVADTFMVDILNQLPAPEEVADAICRVQLTYDRDWEPLLDEKVIYDHFHEAFSIQILKQRHTARRTRLGNTVAVESLSPTELMETYWHTIGLDEKEMKAMQQLAQDVIRGVDIS